MALLKILLVVVTILAFNSAVPLPRNDAHNIYTCVNPNIEKELLAHFPVYVTGKFLQKVSKTIVFPSQGLNNRNITCISILDRTQNGKGAYPKIQSGGIGKYDINILLTSQRSHGINFNIELYADKKRH